MWLENLKRELDSKFPRTIPLLISAEIILKTIVYEEYLRNIIAENIYSEKISFNPEQNYFGRAIFALYRHHKYQLHKWPEYAAFIKQNVPV